MSHSSAIHGAIYIRSLGRKGGLDEIMATLEKSILLYSWMQVINTINSLLSLSIIH